MPEQNKVKGPASYFPSIEKTYGSEHKVGHGHANALVAYHRAQQG
jgi:hypothetical protein